jgi:uncharacterized membrane protein YphA (DoxX/SURF4 family)
MNLRNMPRWLAAIMLLGGILVALFGATMASAQGSFEASSSDLAYDVINKLGMVVGFVGIAMFTAGAWRYAKRD